MGVFWNNAAETWVDISGNSDDNVVSSIVNFVSGSAKPARVDSHFMSESGIIDVFFLLGPRPHDVFRQYSDLTGTAPLPPVSNFVVSIINTILYYVHIIKLYRIIKSVCCVSINPSQDSSQRYDGFPTFWHYSQILFPN